MRGNNTLDHQFQISQPSMKKGQNMQDAVLNHSTQIQHYPQSYYSPTENPFDKKIQEWQTRNVLTTLSREERNKEYAQALIELNDFLDADLEDRTKDSEHVKEMMQCQSMRDLKRVRKELALRSYILTEKEDKDETDKACKEFDKIFGSNTVDIDLDEENEIINVDIEYKVNNSNGQNNS